MRITLTGASGFLGRPLMRHLLAAGHQISLLSRKPSLGLPPEVQVFLWNAQSEEPPLEALAGADAVIHLAGESVSQRWTPGVKKAIRSSRVDSTRLLVQALSTMSERPALLLSGSATGFYGERRDEVLTESAAAGEGFLPEVCVQWEQQANLGRSLGIRVHTLRTGVVLGKGGGALDKMLPPFRAGIGGRLGDGQQWMSWIHVEDWVLLIEHLLHTTLPAGPVNLCAPAPCRNEEFTRALAQALRRPAFLPVPEFALKFLFGEMAEVVLGSQRVIPEAALASGYRFRHPELANALKTLVQ
jgi:uncharacterized protein